MEGARLLHVLARGLSQATTNRLASSLGLGPVHCQVSVRTHKVFTLALCSGKTQLF